jgi:hypothetical protein
MADVTIDGSVSTSTARGMRSVVFTTTLIGYWFCIDSDGTFGYRKTTDGGATWGAEVVISAATTNLAFDVWFDKWTPGDSGTLIHTWYFDTTVSDVLYRTLDTASDTLGTQRVVFAGVSAVAARGVFVSGAKMRSGYLYCAYDIDAGAEKGLHRSTDGGPTWSASLLSTFIEATIDQCLLFPASNTGDDNDCWALYQDASADALTLKMWDSSAVGQVESATIQTMAENVTDLTGQMGFSASVRNSDGHLIVVSASERDTATADVQVFDINGTGSIVTKTAITTNIDDIYYPAVFIDQFTDKIYVAYNGSNDGTEVLGTSSRVYYTVSTDGGTSWSAEQTYKDLVDQLAIFQVWAPLTGPRFFVGWRIGTTLIGNAANSVTFSGLVTLVVADSLIALAAETPALTQANTLVVNDARSLLAAESPALVQANVLAVADVLVALAAESPTLTVGAILLAVADSLIALSSESPALVQANTLAVTDAAIALGAEGPALTQANVLALADVLIALAVESPTLELAGVLAVADALVALAVDSMALTQANVLVVADSTVALTAESPTLSTDAPLVGSTPELGAGGSGRGKGGFELSVSMRAAEARRTGKAKPVRALAAESNPLVSIPAVVEAPRRVVAVEPVEVQAAPFKPAARAEPIDLGPSLIPALEVPEPELFDDSALDGIRARKQAAFDREAHVVAARAELFTRPDIQPVREQSPVAHAALLAQAQRQLLANEEELAWVLLLAA